MILIALLHQVSDKSEGCHIGEKRSVIQAISNLPTTKMANLTKFRHSISFGECDECDEISSNF